MATWQNEHTSVARWNRVLSIRSDKYPKVPGYLIDATNSSNNILSTDVPNCNQFILRVGKLSWFAKKL